MNSTIWNLSEIEPVTDLIWRPWQAELIEKVTSGPERTRIHWVVDRTGRRDERDRVARFLSEQQRVVRIRVPSEQVRIKYGTILLVTPEREDAINGKFVFEELMKLQDLPVVSAPAQRLPIIVLTNFFPDSGWISSGRLRLTHIEGLNGFLAPLFSLQ